MDANDEQNGDGADSYHTCENEGARQPTASGLSHRPIWGGGNFVWHAEASALWVPLRRV